MVEVGGTESVGPRPNAAPETKLIYNAISLSSVEVKYRSKYKHELLLIMSCLPTI